MTAAGESSSSSAGRASLDAASASTSTLPTTTNGTTTTSHDATHSGDEDGWTPLSSMSDAEVRAELTRVRDERDTFESQYRSLLSKLTTMRATLGDRLRQDAEELDRREAQLETLTAKVETLEANEGTLRSELLSSHAETDRLSAELDALRKTLAATEQDVQTRSSSDVGRLERERELHELVERTKLDAHGWETACLEERAKREELESRLADANDALERARQSEAHQRSVAEREAASAANLSAVLAEFQSTQESELQRALGDHRSQLDTLSASLADFKARAESAEARLAQNETLASQSETLAAQVKEKNLLIGKLRHEAVILNEHLTEALRRLRNDQSDSNVDKRLVTNLLLSFLTTPRADGKRYEMLSLIAGVLGWSEDERETAGLQRSQHGRPSLGTRTSTSGGGASSRSVSGSHTPGTAVGGDESFSNLFVEFLLSEAERGKDSAGGKETQSESGTAPGTPLPSRLLSPSRSSFGGSEANSPSKSDAGAAAGANGDEGSRGGLGSYFGLSRGKR